MIRKGLAFFFVFALLFSSASADPWEDLVREKAAQIVDSKFTSEYGVAEYYAECLENYGPFREWTIEQKNWVSQLMPYLMEAEEARVQQYHLTGAPFASFDQTILQWQYGVLEPGLLSQEEARTKAEAFLLAAYGQDESENQVFVNLYTGHTRVGPFPEPYWVLDFVQGDQETAKVWVNARTGFIPKHQALDAERIAASQFAKLMSEGQPSGFSETGGGTKIETISAVYDQNTLEWHVIIEIRDSCLETVVSDVDLQIVRSGIEKP